MKRSVTILIMLSLLLSLSACVQPEAIEPIGEAPSIGGTQNDTHIPATSPQTVQNPTRGYCGNTQTTVFFSDGTKNTFMGSESVTLTDILINLDYKAEKVCKCAAEYTVNTETGTGYAINLTEYFVRYDKGQADLTKEQADTIQKIIDWAKTNKPVASKPQEEQTFAATILEKTDGGVLVEPLEGEKERKSSDKISFATSTLENIQVSVGDVVEITYDGTIMESYPAQIIPTKWKMKMELRRTKYKEQWMQKTEENKKSDGYISGHIVITKIYADCFFALPVVGAPITVKVNGKLEREWCVGDQVFCTYENVYSDFPDEKRAEADMLSIAPSDFTPPKGVAYKPVIYLYPQKTTDVTVKLHLNGKLTCTYPAYKDGWIVSAAPDGTLKDASGQIYNYLYWEGEIKADYDLSNGFCVKGKDTAKFLEEALEKLGLTRKEANEFIVFWLPMMQDNPYNIISFQTKAYTEAAKLEVSPTPDMMIRVFMTWQKSENYIEMPKQVLSAPKREGFTVVEWGGTEITKKMLR